MEFYFTQDFIAEFKKLIKAKEHEDLESLFIEEIFNKTFDEILQIGTSKQSGDNNNSVYVKKRIGKENSGKRGGYRSYISILIKKEKLYFIFIHPKKGRRSMVKLGDKDEFKLLKKFKKDKKNNKLIKVKVKKEENNPDKIIYFKTEKIIF